MGEGSERSGHFTARRVVTGLTHSGRSTVVKDGAATRKVSLANVKCGHPGRCLRRVARPRAEGVSSSTRATRSWSPRSTAKVAVSRTINMLAELRERGIGFTSLHENLDTTTPGGRLVFHVSAALAEFIRELIIIDTKEGLAAARARGRVVGRPTVATEEIIRTARDLLPDPAAPSPRLPNCSASPRAPSTATSRTCASCAPAPCPVSSKRRRSRPTPARSISAALST